MDKPILNQPAMPNTSGDNPSRVVSLKVNVSEDDLAAGRFKATTTPSTPIPTPARRRRGRPRKASVLAAIAARTSNPNPEHQQPQSPSLPEFRSISTYSFPVLVTPPRPVQGPGLNPHALVPPASTPITSATTYEASDQQPITQPNPNNGAVSNIVTTKPLPNKGPNTAGFWWDRAIAEQALSSNDIDFKMMCLKMMRWKEQNDVPHEQAMADASWAIMVGDAVARGKAWRRARRQNEGTIRKAAGWAVWESRKRSASRGRFVEDGPRGGWVLREPGLNGKKVKVLRLGYKREGRPRGDGSFDKGIADHWVDAAEFRDAVRRADALEPEGRG